MCTHQPRAPGPRGGAVELLKARHAWQSPSRRPRPRQLAAGHCREGRGQGSLSTGAQGTWEGLWTRGFWGRRDQETRKWELQVGLRCGRLEGSGKAEGSKHKAGRTRPRGRGRQGSRSTHQDSAMRTLGMKHVSRLGQVLVYLVEAKGDTQGGSLCQGDREPGGSLTASEGVPGGGAAWQAP